MDFFDNSFELFFAIVNEAMRSGQNLASLFRGTPADGFGPSISLVNNRVAVAKATAVRKANTKLKGLILAQNERWRRGLGMQVVREVFLLAKKLKAAKGRVTRGYLPSDPG